MTGANRAGGAKLDIDRLVDAVNRMDPLVRAVLVHVLRDAFPEVVWTTQRGLLRVATHAGYKP